MGFFDLFRRAEPIAERGALMAFLDAQAAFLTQKGMFEYSRARAGPYGNVLFSDEVFLAELEKARWIAFPVGLAMVGRGSGRRLAAGGRRSPRPRLARRTRRRARYHRSLSRAGGSEHRRLGGSAASIGARSYACRPAWYQACHGHPAPLCRFKTNLCNIHDVFVRRADVPALVESLTTAD